MPRDAPRLLWMDQLRGFVTLLVVAHHAAMAYAGFGKFHPEAYILSTHPIVDLASRWKGFDLFIGFNDIYFMPLMFLISGSFVLRSIEKRGRTAFIRERLMRLFVPFALAVTFLMPLAYYPAWMEARAVGSTGGGLPGVSAGFSDFLVDFFTTEAWPVGPPWFIWELFVFNLILVWMYPRVRAFLDMCRGALAGVRTSLEVLLIGYMITWIAYVPFAGLAGPYAWTGFGPFDFQVARVLLYFVYFLFGTVLGDSIDALAARWRFWVVGAVVVAVVYFVSDRWLPLLHVRASAARCICRSLWSLSCVMSCGGFLVLFKKGGGWFFGGRFFRNSWFWRSLPANAYGIYLVHYVIIVWLQWWLLPLALSGVMKFLIVAIGGIAGSWILVMVWRLGIRWVKGFVKDGLEGGALE